MTPEQVYSRFVQPGDLVFDIGANVGARTATFLNMGCRVVAVEPNPEEAAQISAQATVLSGFAVAERSGRGILHLCTEKPYLASLVDSYRDFYPDDRFDRDLDVELVTLDDLIVEYGVPAFVKVDVEGGEANVLRGLHTPLDAMSLELHSFDTEKTSTVLGMIDRLGPYDLEFGMRETFELIPWTPRIAIDIYGDLYAIRRT